MSKLKTGVQNRVAEVRKGRGIGASDLAQRIQVSRQTIYAIEAGTYVPNTEVALSLARELEVTVDHLFSLRADPGKSSGSMQAEILSPTAPHEGQAIRIGQVGSRWVGVPVSAAPYYLPEADGTVKRSSARNGRSDLSIFAKPEAPENRLVLAGCDPAIGLLSRMVEKASGVEIVSCAASSELALTWLREGKVHIAGSHLQDPTTGEFNLPFIRRHFPDGDFLVVTFAGWEEGFVTASGNPKGVRRVEDLVRRNVKVINREPGSGSRGLLDKLLAQAGVENSKVSGYARIADGHLAAAYSVLSGNADVCLATRSAAQTFGLEFVALHQERYDLVMRKRTAELPAVKTFLDVLQRAALRRKLEVLAGYDTSRTGSVPA